MTKYIDFPHSIVNYSITSCSNELMSMMEAVYFLSDDNNMTCDNTVNITVNQDPINVFVSRSGERIESFLNISNIHLCFIKITEIIRNTLEFENGWNPYHGTAISHEHITYVFLGESRSGKTTLAAYLANYRDMQIVAEDLVLINYNTFEIATYKRPLLLRSGGYNLLTKKYGIDFVDVRPINISYETKMLIQSNYANDNVKYYASCAIILELSKAPINIYPIKEKGRYLIHSYLHNTMLKNTVSAILIERQLPLYRMSYYDLAEVYKLITNRAFIDNYCTGLPDVENDSARKN